MCHEQLKLHFADCKAMYFSVVSRRFCLVQQGFSTERSLCFSSSRWIVFGEEEEKKGSHNTRRPHDRLRFQRRGSRMFHLKLMFHLKDMGQFFISYRCSTYLVQLIRPKISDKLLGREKGPLKILSGWINCVDRKRGKAKWQQQQWNELKLRQLDSQMGLNLEWISFLQRRFKESFCELLSHCRLTPITNGRRRACIAFVRKTQEVS